MIKNPLLVTIPHSGENIPDLAPWLKELPEEILMCDVDRYVDLLYLDALNILEIPSVKTKWHRYAADLNRIPSDVDCDSVVGSSNPSGSFNRGFHWTVTTYNHQLMKNAMDFETHKKLVDLIYSPFHQSVQSVYQQILEHGYSSIYHIDAHSMPSVGTKMHRDSGEIRAEVVISDCLGTSCSKGFRDLVIAAYVTAGFKVGYNWPYFGGRMTEQYGHPDKHQHSIQVELNRSIYMNEKTKKIEKSEFDKVKIKLEKALKYILENLPKA